MDIIAQLQEKLGLGREQVENVIELLDAGNTVPFIARYRKEKTGSMDDTTLRSFAELLQSLRNLEKRRTEVFEAIQAQEKMTPELEAAIAAAATLTALEDIYRPFRPKRKTRASVAREKGLEGLAEIIFAQGKGEALEVLAEAYLNSEKGVESIEDAIAGALDIVAEDISDNAEIRGELRKLLFSEAKITSKQQEGEDIGVYGMYADFSEAVKTLPGHRILALNRGEKEGVLKVSVELGEYLPLSLLENRLMDPRSDYKGAMEKAIADSYSRLLFPSLEREIRNDLFDKASEAALVVFADNLRHLLLASPLKGKVVMGFDPGYRTGCKIAVVDETGKVLDTAVVYPTKPQERTEESEKKLCSMIRKWGVNAIAIGNGTASKESEIFIADMIAKHSLSARYQMVSEAGASVYSASPLAAEEFPDYDVTLRSAVSIARRLQDPLAELVKIEPRSIGVGQYQHDLKPARLAEALGGVVEACVNSVGVDLNTASRSLLSYVAGLNSATAKNIVAYREENGAFRSRKELLKVPKIGKTAFRQCAGFLRVPGGGELLDNTAVHPESYEAAEKLISRLGFEKKDLEGGIAGISLALEKEGKNKICEELGIGLFTLNDIATELEKPGRDWRDELPPPELRGDVLGLEDLVEGEIYSGVVRNVCDFGVFVDIGVHQDGLVHISKICDRFIRHPSEVLHVGEAVKVSVLSVDKIRNKISLNMKGINQK